VINPGFIYLFYLYTQSNYWGWSTLYLTSWHIHYQGYGRSETETTTSMPLKAVPAAQVLAATATTLGPSNIQGDISMAKSSEQSVEWYREMII
jgi:hypothetical protein